MDRDLILKDNEGRDNMISKMRRLLRRIVIIASFNIRKTANIAWSSKVDSGTILEGNNVIHRGVNISGSKVGYASYIGENSILPFTKIGKFCSISWNVEVVAGRHPSQFVSTHPIFYSKKSFNGLNYCKNQIFQEYRYADGKYLVHIGNDVLIGTGVKIMDGVSIGNGAIITAGAVVTKDIPPYAIVGGVPLQIIKYRFSEERIAWLQQFCWWDQSDEWLRANCKYFGKVEELQRRIADDKY